MKTVKEILTEAAALGRKVGVTKGTFFNKKHGSMCINGLIGSVIAGEPIKTTSEYDRIVKSDDFATVVKVVAPIISVESRWGALATWNNSDETSNEDVLNALDRAAASLA